jgi:hypothetical protein
MALRLKHDVVGSMLNQVISLGDLRMEIAEIWRSLFEGWPEHIPRQGVVVTTGGESIPFKDFLISGRLLLVERTSPDVSGAARVVLMYESISVVKLTTPGELSQYQAMGFQPPL